MGADQQSAIVMPPARGGLPARTTKLVIDYIEDHLNEDVSLVELAELAGLSQFHLCRAFKQATGLPPHRYQIKLRVERAKELLEASHLPISEIALAVGYDDQGQLARLFRKEAGTTPSQYRRDRQN
ncbi:MAG: AraC family transcriptional regulator [Alphaproteobacteria bacterium]